MSTFVPVPFGAEPPNSLLVVGKDVLFLILDQLEQFIPAKLAGLYREAVKVAKEWLASSPDAANFRVNYASATGAAPDVVKAGFEQIVRDLIKKVVDGRIPIISKILERVAAEQLGALLDRLYDSWLALTAPAAKDGKANKDNKDNKGGAIAFTAAPVAQVSMSFGDLM